MSRRRPRWGRTPTHASPLKSVFGLPGLRHGGRIVASTVARVPKNETPMDARSVGDKRFRAARQIASAGEVRPHSMIAIFILSPMCDDVGAGVIEDLPSSPKRTRARRNSTVRHRRAMSWQEAGLRWSRTPPVVVAAARGHLNAHEPDFDKTMNMQICRVLRTAAWVTAMPLCAALGGASASAAPNAASSGPAPEPPKTEPPSDSAGPSSKPPESGGPGPSQPPPNAPAPGTQGGQAAPPPAAPTPSPAPEQSPTTEPGSGATDPGTAEPPQPGTGPAATGSDAQPPATGAAAPGAAAPGTAAPGAAAPGTAAPGAAAPGTAAPVGLVAPELEHFVDAVYPAEALTARIAGQVVLRLSLDAEGKVTLAEVMEPAGHGFDEAAIAAAQQFRFAPAKRDGIAVPSRILYTYTFTLPEEPPPADQGPVGVVSGRALLPGEEEVPVVGALVTLTDASGAVHTTRSDAEGTYRIEALPPGTYKLRIEAPGLSSAELDVVVTAGAVAEPTMKLLAAESDAAVTVTVHGETEAERLRESARAVTVVDLEQARKRTADLGEVLARTQGVGVRRAGGLGSGSQISLAGLTNDQIRFFLDGIPLELAGISSDISAVPVNIIDYIAIYRGVVPTSYGSDSLGGAIDLVTDQNLEGTRGVASFEAGSFGTYRIATKVRHLAPRTGIFTRFWGFFDIADNDYPIDVEVPDDVGRLSPATVYRFNDRYRATGGSGEFGFVNRPWAERLLVRVFGSGYDKQLQHNAVMTVPYGEVEYGEIATGATLRYKNTFIKKITLEVLGGYTYNRVRFYDVGECVYDWFGQCVRPRRQPGETDSQPHDQLQWAHNGYGRLNLGWRIRPEHALLLSFAPTYAARTGDEREQVDPNSRDPLSAKRNLLTVVTGLEYSLDVLKNKLKNIFFLKYYAQVLRAEDPLPGGVFRDRERDSQYFGIGNSFRYKILEWLYAKASYEWATRLPRPDEIFGDGVQIIANLDLQPERSHNANASVVIDARRTVAGAWRLDVNGFLRDADQLIVLLGNDRVFSFQNVFGARSLGVEAVAGWTSPGDYFSLDGNVTYQSFRNSSDEGTFGDFEGDRIPNRPYLFANGAASLQFKRISALDDKISLNWNTRYTHKFYRGWESVGQPEFKQFVPNQLMHAVGVLYEVHGKPLQVSFSGEIDNITNVKAYDFFGVQRPGRSFHFKVNAEF